MSLPIVYRPQARIDLIEQAEHIAGDSESTADRFVNAVANTIQFLSAFPETRFRFVTVHPRLVGIRCRRVQGFPRHLIFYFHRDEHVEIVRLLHGSRDLDAALDA